MPIVAEYFGGPWDGMKQTFETDVEWVEVPIIPNPVWKDERKHWYYRIASDILLYMGVYGDM